jgi:hypothetical protein
MELSCAPGERFRYGALRKSSQNQPSSNVLIVCSLCYPTFPNKLRSAPAIFKYDMLDHIRDAHVDFATPVQPSANEKLAPSRPARSGWRLPPEMCESLEFCENEEALMEVPISDRWCAIGALRPEDIDRQPVDLVELAAGTSAGSSAPRRKRKYRHAESQSEIKRRHVDK